MTALKRYLWLVHLALIAAGVYIGADLFWAIVGTRIESGGRLPIASPTAAAETTAKATLQQYTVIQERNLFGARGRSAVAPPVRPPTPPPSAPKPAANLKLVGTVVGIPERTYAVIEDLGTKRQDLYRLGDMVREAKVVEVTRNRVVLDTRGRREELVSFEKSDGTSPPAGEAAARQLTTARRVSAAPVSPSAQPPVLPLQENPETSEDSEEETVEVDIERVSENTWRLSRDDLVEQIDSFAQMMQEARLTPHFTAGQPDGFMITNLPRNSFLARMGLRSGDIMKGVNGERFGSLEEFFQAYQQLQTAPTLQIEVERSNRTETLTYEIR